MVIMSVGLIIKAEYDLCAQQDVQWREENKVSTILDWYEMPEVRTTGISDSFHLIP